MGGRPRCNTQTVEYSSWCTLIPTTGSGAGGQEPAAENRLSGKQSETKDKTRDTWKHDLTM